ncbi:addiction module protein [Hyunsoonleella ulvae]|uniref:addiction module protein n=1 Tax=Hyunsoonleella ulvae TaxID=2799948 RepID=UPI001939ACFE|nr:addiction module protein [Hyunsoonleella ulvae]
MSSSDGKHGVLGMICEAINNENLIIRILVIMAEIELRNSLIKRFNRIIKDDSKLMTLDGIFDSINAVESSSVVPEEHYKIVEERRRKHQVGETKGKSWDDVKSGIKKKYGF